MTDFFRSLNHAVQTTTDFGKLPHQGNALCARARPDPTFVRQGQRMHAYATARQLGRQFPDKPITALIRVLTVLQLDTTVADPDDIYRATIGVLEVPQCKVQSRFGVGATTARHQMLTFNLGNLAPEGVCDTVFDHSLSGTGVPPDARLSVLRQKGHEFSNKLRP